LQTEITLNPIVALDPKRHNRSAFTCGINQLDVFIQQKARKEAPDLSLTFVLTCREEPGEILGFYSLSATKLEAGDLTAELRREIGQYGCIPATLLGRLATATKYQRNKELRIGELLLLDAMFRTQLAARHVASFGMIVDVFKTEASDPTGFYRRYGFIECVETDDRMYLPMKTIEDTLREAGITGGG
jgi:hypothetical protein